MLPYPTIELFSAAFRAMVHSTEVTVCNLAPIKVAVNPFVFIESYTLPAGLKEWETDVEITVPRNNENDVFDEGDYHFFVSLTDNEGWSAQREISIKMLFRYYNALPKRDLEVKKAKILA